MGTINRSDLAETCLFALDYPNKLHLTFEVIESDENGQSTCGEIFSSLAVDPVL